MPKMPLPAQATAFQSLRAEMGGLRLHYHVGGDPDGPPVLLWHGFLSTSQVWRKVMPLLADAGYAVLAPDMRGYGDSDKPPGTAGCCSSVTTWAHRPRCCGPPIIRRRSRDCCTSKRP